MWMMCLFEFCSDFVDILCIMIVWDSVHLFLEHEDCQKQLKEMYLM